VEGNLQAAMNLTNPNANTFEINHLTIQGSFYSLTVASNTSGATAAYSQLGMNLDGFFSGPPHE
jgi:hypothetical protein